MKTDMITAGERPQIGAPYVCPLEMVQHLESSGGKAFNLGRMIDLRIAVPRGFVVTDLAFQEFLDDNQLRAPIAAMLAGLQADRPEVLRATAEAIRGRVVAGTIPERILASIHELLWETLPGATLAVRSSAVGEDSHQAAFAGQLDSFLDVDSDHRLQEALLACWASYWSQRSLFYQLSRGVHLSGMGVVIQELVASRISGILFTQNPESSNGASDFLVVEYCYGYGDDLAAGKINPGRFAISRRNNHWHRLASAEQDGGADDGCLFNDEQISNLARAALTVEEAFGCPQDIEWTIDQAGQLFLVQTRPITIAATVTPRPSQSPHDRIPPGELVVWSNANVNENFPAPISPLLYSIASLGYYHYFRNLGLALGISPRRASAMEYPLRNVIGVHRARMYYNLTSIHTLLRMAPFGDLLTGWFDSFVGAPQTARSPQTEVWKTSRGNRFRRLGEACGIGLKTTWQFLFLSQRIEAFERTINEFAEETAPERLNEQSLPELLDHLRSFLDIRCHRWTNASLADTAAMVSYGILKQFLITEFPNQDQSSLHNSLLKGLRDVVSSVPIAELWDLSRMIRNDGALAELFAANDDAKILQEIRGNGEFTEFREVFDAFLENWGFRCSGELMLTSPSFQENPSALLEILKAYVKRNGESPWDQLRRQESERSAETASVLSQLKRRKLFRWLPWPTKSSLVKIVLKWSHKSIALRERARLKQALLYSRCRRIALAIGNQLVPLGLLEDQDDVFYLTHQEIEDLLSGNAMFPHQTKELIRVRKTGQAHLSAMTPPDDFRLPAGAYLSADQSQRTLPSEAVEAGSQNELIGVGACGGQATAPAAILQDVSECHLLSDGEILVTRQTDPGWGPVFFLIKGLVMERGGMLSHGAILAREYGIPTVVGVQNATRRISPGQTLCVNGDRGIVQLAN